MTSHDQEGRPVPDLFDSEAAFEIPSLGSRVLRSAGAGGDSAGLDPGADRDAAGEWIVDLRTLRNRRGSGGGAGRAGQSFRPVRGGIRRSGDRVGRVQAGSGFPDRVAAAGRIGARPVGGRVHPLERFPAVGTHAFGMVRRGRGGDGVPDGLPGTSVAADGGRIGVRSTGAAVRQGDGGALGGSVDPDRGRGQDRRWSGDRGRGWDRRWGPGAPAVGDPVGVAEFDRPGAEHDAEVVVNECGERGDHAGDRRGADLGDAAGVAGANDSVPDHRAGCGRADGDGIGDGDGGRFGAAGARGAVRSDRRAELGQQRELADRRATGRVVRRDDESRGTCCQLGDVLLGWGTVDQQ